MLDGPGGGGDLLFDEWTVVSKTLLLDLRNILLRSLGHLDFAFRVLEILAPDKHPAWVCCFGAHGSVIFPKFSWRVCRAFWDNSSRLTS